MIRYYVTPTIYTINDIRIIPVEVTGDFGNELVGVRAIDFAGGFRTAKSNIYDSKEDAMKVLETATLAFIENVRYHLTKASKECRNTDGR